MPRSYLLLQVRRADDPMRRQETRCFADALDCDVQAIDVFDLLSGCPSVSELAPYDAVLIGGSGDYSVARGGPWLAPALDAMRELAEMAKPTFASCWGFQALALALGGEVRHDPQRAELGTLDLRLTDAGRRDPLFGPLAQAGAHFAAHVGHEDRVTRLPAQAVLLAESDRSPHAYVIDGMPIYGTQFHPELTRDTLLERFRQYPRYVAEISGLPVDEFAERHTRDAPHADRLLARFVEVVFG